MDPQDSSVPRSLIEYFGGFNYDYLMHCVCGRTSVVTADVYWERQSIDALVPCQHCGQSIHFGPAVAALRDSNDPALSNDAIRDLAWYHTSTFPDWPSAGFSSSVRAQWGNQPRYSGISVEEVIRRQVNKALHVGSYESAIENMLRRMRDQDDRGSVFYLHRVAINIRLGDLNDGIRDENHEPASQLDLNQLKAEGLRAIRYLNVREAPGTVSLAIDPSAIESIQTLQLPALTLAPKIPNDLLPALEAIETALADAAAAMPDTSHLDPRHVRMLALGARSDDDDLGPRIRQSETCTWQAWQELEQLLQDRYLIGVNPVVRDNYTSAMGRRSSVATFEEHFRAHSVALTRPDDVVALLVQQPIRLGVV